jgi:BCD family chlorophyll transporter-like MFS transporter
MTATPSLPTPAAERRLTWGQMARLGVVQAAIGAVVVLMTSTMNRVMIVELGLSASIPGLLVALHFGVQLALRPRMGFGSDVGGRRTPWILWGMGVLAVGGIGAALSVRLMRDDPTLGVLGAAVAFVVLGAGVSAAGTPLLALGAERSGPRQRAATAAVMWILMIVGFAVTAGTAGRLLDPFSYDRLVSVTAAVCAIAAVVAALAIRGIEGGRPGTVPFTTPVPESEERRFALALRSVWGEQSARTFALFVFVAMLAYSAQDLILEPFGGVAFGLTPGQTTQLSGTQHGGVLLGMILTAVVGSRVGALRTWATLGCAASAASFALLAATPLGATVTTFKAVVFTLGFSNGVFAIGAIGSMMANTGGETGGRAGLRLGVYGAAQAVAYAIGGFAGAAALDVARALAGSPVSAYAAVFLGEGVLFAAAAVLAARSGARETAGAVLATRADALMTVARS